MKPAFLLFLLTLASGCAIQNIKYDRDKILRKYSDTYTTFIDQNKEDFKSVYLDRDNIESIQIDRKKKALKITQIKQVDLLEIRQVNWDSINGTKESERKGRIDMVVVNAVILTIDDRNKPKIDLNAILAMKIMQQEESKMVGCNRGDGRILLIITK